MTKNEKQDLEALKIGFEMNEWEYFLLILNEIKSRDKEIIALYRKSHKKLKGIENEDAIKKLEKYKIDLVLKIQTAKKEDKLYSLQVLSMELLGINKAIDILKLKPQKQ